MIPEYLIVQTKLKAVIRHGLAEATWWVSSWNLGCFAFSLSCFFHVFHVFSGSISVSGYRQKKCPCAVQCLKDGHRWSPFAQAQGAWHSCYGHVLTGILPHTKLQFFKTQKQQLSRCSIQIISWISRTSRTFKPKVHRLKGIHSNGGSLQFVAP